MNVLSQKCHERKQRIIRRKPQGLVSPPLGVFENGVGPVGLSDKADYSTTNSRSSTPRGLPFRCPTSAQFGPSGLSKPPKNRGLETRLRLGIASRPNSRLVAVSAYSTLDGVLLACMSHEVALVSGGSPESVECEY